MISKSADGHPMIERPWRYASYPILALIKAHALLNWRHRDRVDDIYGRTLADATFRKEILPTLESAGLVVQEPDPEDRRRLLVCPPIPSPISLEQVAGQEKKGKQ